MEMETVKMSSKGQVVIPQGIRNELHAGEGTLFVVIGSKDTVLLKKLEKPSKEDLIAKLESIAKEGRRRLESKGIKEEDIHDIVEKSRRK